MDFSYSSRVRDQLVVPNRDKPLITGQAPAFLDHSSLFDSTLGSNEGEILNPNGRVSPDKMEPDQSKSKPTKLLRCSNFLKISTFNVRTLSGPTQLNELVLSMSNNSIDIIALQEHRIFHPDDDLIYDSISSSQLITSSATKNTVNASVGGIGFLLSSRAASNLIRIEKITPRIVIAEFSSNPVLTVVCAYSPHNSAPEEDVEEFYSSLKNLLSHIPRHNFLSIAGDFNAKLAYPDVPFSFDKATNRNGEHLLDLLQEFDLFSSNNSFMKCANHLWTFKYPNGDKAQIDYIIFRKKWRNSIQDSRAYSSFATVSTDHRIVSSKVKLSLRSSKPSKPNPLKQIDWKRASTNPEVCSMFGIEVFNRFSILFNEELTKDNVELAYSCLKDSTEKVALEQLPRKQKRAKSDPKECPLVKKARENLTKASSLYNAAPTRRRKEQLTSAKIKLDEAYLEAQVFFY
ncbi:craniofacial development protein 2-like [Clytia hemisphaerica]|uniref:craniofacial development protein 2-like n=1 Tax=Clytia hemisphaerica TaxID=252671 RepID=UPI0034D5D6D4